MTQSNDLDKYNHNWDWANSELSELPEAPPCFKCTVCGDCCRTTDPNMGVTLNYADVVRIAGHLGMSVEEFMTIHANRFEFEVNGQIYEAFHLDFTEIGCRFLRDDNLCSIHSVKPMQCRFTPYRFFWDGESDGESDLWCMKCVEVPKGWTSQHVDDIFLQGLRKVSSKEE